MKTRAELYRARIGVALLFLLLAAHGSSSAGTVAAHWIGSTETLLTGEYADGRISDLVLENDEIAVVISAIGHTVYYTESGGNIIDAGLAGPREDALAEFYTYFDDDWPRQAVYTTLEIVDNGSSGGPAVVRAVGTDSDDPNLLVETEYVLEVGERFLTITTEIENTGGTTYPGFEVGDAFSWGSCENFAPGYGFGLAGTTSETWLAGTSGDISYGYVSTHGTIWGPNGGGWSDVNNTTVYLGPGETASYTRWFVVGGRDIASVATIIHEVKNYSTGSVTCNVTNQSNGNPLRNVEVDIFDSYGNIYAQMTTDSAGTSSGTLLPDQWDFTASRAGLLPADTSVSVGVGDNLTINMGLMPEGNGGYGDTLTIIQRPLLNIPLLTAPGDTVTIECDADQSTAGWNANLIYNNITVPLQLLTATYNASTLWWELSVVVPEVPLYELYDLQVTADGPIEDVTWNAVRVIPAFKDDYYFVQLTDTHLPTHLYYYQQGADEDTSEMEDLRAVIDDINLINPEFVLLTGDLVNEGELEDYLDWHVYSRSQKLLSRFEVPVYLIAGNHDIGGWDSTPPPDGTARKDWWRFYGWKRLNNPPPGAPWYTQNYSFDYGPVHYMALEAYDNYDGWKYSIYGSESFTSGQLQWLDQELVASSGSTSHVLFYHYDFSNQINLNALGVDMALWGHIHSNDGNINNPPYDLATNNVCDGERSYRLIRVSDGILDPTGPVSSGSSGGNLNVQYTPANDGTNYEVTAQIYNSLSKQFEHAQLKFVMPKAAGDAVVTGGTLAQVDTSGSFDVYYVAVDIQPSSSQSVTITLDASAIGDVHDVMIGADPMLRSYPNPFNPTVEISFEMPAAGYAKLSVFDIEGRSVSVLLDDFVEEGVHRISWDGTDHRGRQLASGVYLVKLNTNVGARTMKAVLMR